MGVTLAGNQLLSAESCIWGLGALRRLHRVPFAPELLRRRFPPPYAQNIFQCVAEALDFKCGWRVVAAIIQPVSTNVILPMDRALVQAGKICRSLGDDEGIVRPFPDKPKPMRWRAYDRLRERCERYEARS